MEQVIWLFVGVVSVMIALGIVFNVFEKVKDERKDNDVVYALEKLESNINFVCRSTPDTKIGTKINIPGGTILWAESSRLCLKYADNVQCVIINCNFSDPYKLDLNTSIARKINSWKYNCITRKADRKNVSIECQG